VGASSDPTEAGFSTGETSRLGASVDGVMPIESVGSLRGVGNRTGTPQGGSLSPILANIFLHSVLDLWFEKKTKPRVRGVCHPRPFGETC
jgi:hypothetical protein